MSSGPGDHAAHQAESLAFLMSNPEISNYILTTPAVSQLLNSVPGAAAAAAGFVAMNPYLFVPPVMSGGDPSGITSGPSGTYFITSTGPAIDNISVTGPVRSIIPENIPSPIFNTTGAVTGAVAPATGALATGAPATGALATGAVAPATGAVAPATGAPATGAPATGAPATGALATILPPLNSPIIAITSVATGADMSVATGADMSGTDIIMRPTIMPRPSSRPPLFLSAESFFTPLVNMIKSAMAGPPPPITDVSGTSTGDTGDTGDTGNTGNTGDTGDTGNTGDTGDTSNTSNTGNTSNTSVNNSSSGGGKRREPKKRKTRRRLKARK